MFTPRARISVRFLLRSLLPVITPIFRGLRSARYLLFLWTLPLG